jgi:hypothetical protein
MNLKIVQITSEQLHDQYDIKEHTYCDVLHHAEIMFPPCRAEESRREPTKAEESWSEPNQQKGGMFILRCSATVGYTRYAISTKIVTVFGGVRSEELSWKPSAIQSQSLEVSSREES